jgi:hypothetical protein
MTKELYTPKVGLQDLMLEAAKEMKSFPVAMGFKMANQVLLDIAKHALEVKDEKLIKMLQSICVLTSEGDDNVG